MTNMTNNDTNTKAEADLTRILERRDYALTREHWRDLIVWYTNESNARVGPPIDAQP